MTREGIGVAAANESAAELRLGELLGEDDLAELRTALPPGARSTYARHYRVSSWSPALEEHFRAMAESCMKVAHSTVTPVVGFGVARERPFIVYERRPSISLRELLRHTNELSAPSAAWLLTRVAVALDLVPRLAHGGVSPDSILLNGEGEVEVRDLGVLALGARAGMGAKNEIVAGYCAPEVIDGSAPTASASVFALGACVYEALMGERPFRGRTMMANVVHAKMGKFQRIGEERAPAELRDLVHRMLSAEPAERPMLAELTREGAKLAWRDGRPADLGAMVREWLPQGEPVPEVPEAPENGSGSLARDTSPSVPLPPEPSAPSAAPSLHEAAEMPLPAPADMAPSTEPPFSLHELFPQNVGWEKEAETRAEPPRVEVASPPRPPSWDAAPGFVPTVLLEAPPPRAELGAPPDAEARSTSVPAPLHRATWTPASTRNKVLVVLAALAIFDLLLLALFLHVTMG